MHVVNPHWVSGTRRRCQAIAVLISLQLCLISSVEANHLTVGELGSPDTDTVEPTWKRLWGTSHLIHSFFSSSTFIYLRGFAEQCKLDFQRRPTSHSVKHTSCWELPSAACLHCCSLGAEYNHHFLLFPSEWFWDEVEFWCLFFLSLLERVISYIS